MTNPRPATWTAAALLALLATAPVAAQEQTFNACYVPDVGAIYLIGIDGLPTECLASSHVEISWSEGQAGITDHGELAGLGDDDHPEYVREGEAAAGDLSGVFPEPMVAALRGRALSSTEPTDGQVLVWNAADGVWEPRTSDAAITDHGDLAGLADDDHPEYVREGEAAGGDLSGTFPDPAVVALRGIPIEETTPSSNQVLTWQSPGVWAPLDQRTLTQTEVSAYIDDWHAGNSDVFVGEGEAAGGDLGGTYPAPSVTALRGSVVAATAPSAGQVLTWNATTAEWEPQAPAAGVTDHGDLSGLTDDDHPAYVREGEAAGGDLGGTYPSPSVTALQGSLVATTAPSAGQVLTWNATAAEWEPQAPPTGVTDHGSLTGLADDDHPEYVREGEAAGGDLSGTFPSPAVAALQGNAVASTAPADAQVLTWNAADAQWRPEAVPSGVTDHGELAGLGDDDHAQYLLTEGVRFSPDGFAVTGSVTSGSIPTEGAGTRLMWYSHYGALRAGRVESSEWDASNVGRYTFGAGYNTLASGFYSAAMGRDTRAIGVAATAVGDNTVAGGSFSTAMGENTAATGDFSTAMGDNTRAAGPSSTSMGSNTYAAAHYSTAMGWNTEAQAGASLVIGGFNVVEGDPGGWVSTDPLFVAGNGTSSTAPSNALTLLKNGDMTIAGTLTESSDARLKIGIEPLGPALETVRQLNPVRFRFREGTGHPADVQIGLIAQEVAEAFPELVSTDSEGYLSLAYPKLTAILVRAIQEQQDLIDAQRERIQAQRTALEHERATIRQQQEALQRQQTILTELEARLDELERKVRQR